MFRLLMIFGQLWGEPRAPTFKESECPSRFLC